ncbi:GIY-YIG nuclease family protein [Bombilactobacillus bombi]|uniref:GIY-YIG nuclease family protein n=1 Tax=Bombilactobacillus bombi TaxID=1303590 RepID=UPI0015E5DD2D|nr:GIY-YIG nuclease family protein [Bombilactobacillus bombi]MBA1395301.1 GIY-YIG nuclease family protein [Lactobacillus sp. XV13L]MBA1434821.1 GIY-YIG nuclease family protein [Bombilactobacillus bombi]
MSKTNSYSVYIVHCVDGSYYTGISNNVPARIATHNAGKGAKYTKIRRPVKLVYQELVGDRSQASKREWQIKHYTRAQKIKLFHLKP